MNHPSSFLLHPSEGGILSVALSRSLPSGLRSLTLPARLGAWMVDVIHRRVLWSPDFPRIRRGRTRDRLADSRMQVP
jgi:hypothetical protein